MKVFFLKIFDNNISFLNLLISWGSFNVWFYVITPISPCLESLHSFPEISKFCFTRFQTFTHFIIHLPRCILYTLITIPNLFFFIYNFLLYLTIHHLDFLSSIRSIKGILHHPFHLIFSFHQLCPGYFDIISSIFMESLFTSTQSWTHFVIGFSC